MNPDEMLRDPLTGAYSRAVLQHRLQEEVERARRYREDFSILFLDLDHFKSINDAFGHSRGDQLLIGFVESLRPIIRAADILIRYGGDEFLLLLPNTCKQQALVTAERLLEDIRGIAFPGDPPLSLSLSIGVVSFPEDGETPESLFDQADLRVYEAKRRGRGQVIGCSMAESNLLPFDDTSRLVEREEALASLYSFIKQLPEQKRGRLMITGRAGCGKSRFLIEVGKAGRLLGYEVASLQGSHAMATRTYGVLNEAFKEWNLPSPLFGAMEFGQALQSLLDSRGRSGLFLCAEQIQDFDWATLELFQHLFISTAIPRIALAYTHSPEASKRIFLPEAPLNDTIEIRPLSKEGLHIWMRTLIQSEPAPAVVDRLFGVTQGKPGFVQKSLYTLIDRGGLKRAAQGWVFEPDFDKHLPVDSIILQSQPPAHNLPIPPTNILGRDKEIQHVKDLLKEKRLITLMGPGGIGKTRLVLQVAYEVLDHYPQGVYFVPLALIHSPDLIVSAIAEQVRFTFYGQDEPALQLINYLREKRMLLVLDNFEHIIQAAETIARILEYAPYLKILVTSRERLNLQGESILEVKGMAVPKKRDSQPLEIYSGVQLFLMYARQMQPDFRLTEDNKADVARICQLLEGMPLGIELAATWVRTLSCQEIAAEIEQNIDFLVTQLRDIPDRHRSLRAVFEHSWNLLTDQERDVLQRISVFPGGFRREAAQVVAKASLADLSSFVNKSLLYKNESNRYRMHEVLLKYAAEKLDQSLEEKQNTLDRYCSFYASYLKQKQENLGGKNQKNTLEGIQEELNNIRLVWEISVRDQQMNRIDQAMDSLFSFYEIRGLYHEGLDSSRKAAEMVRSELKQSQQTMPFYEILLGKLLSWQGAFSIYLTQQKKAKQLFDRAYELLSRREEKSALAFLYWRLGILEDGLSNFPAEHRACSDSLALYRECGDDHGAATALNQLGVATYRLGDYPQAKAIFQEFLDISQQIEDRRGISIAMINLGIIASEIGDLDEATQQYQSGLNICIELGDKMGTAILLNNLGDAALIQNQLEKAQQYLEESSSIYTELGDKSGLSTPLFNLAEIAYRQGELEKARALFEESLAISTGSGNQVDQGYCLARLGIVASAMKNEPAAHAYLKRGLEIACENYSTLMIVEVLIAIAELYFRQHKEEPAARILSIILHQPNISVDIKNRVTSLNQRYAPTTTDGIMGAVSQEGVDPSLDKALKDLKKEFDRRD